MEEFFDERRLALRLDLLCRWPECLLTSGKNQGISLAPGPVVERSLQSTKIIKSPICLFLSIPNGLLVFTELINFFSVAFVVDVAIWKEKRLLLVCTRASQPLSSGWELNSNIFVLHCSPQWCCWQAVLACIHWVPPRWLLRAACLKNYYCFSRERTTEEGREPSWSTIQTELAVEAWNSL